MIHLAPISTRNQFGKLLNDLGLTGLAVEVGTHRGDFAEVLLEGWHGRKLHCVDPWDVPPGYEDQAETLKAALFGGTRDDDYAFTQARLMKFKGRAKLIKATSMEALNYFDNATLDFVYIDGDHSFKAVYEDVKYWWTRVKPGGILAGHDILCPGEPEGGWGMEIQPVVFRHAELTGLDVYLVPESGYPWSWYIVKGATND